MLNSVLGKKIGMTQIFTKNGAVVPVTVINVSNWFVTQIKSMQNDGYFALQLGLPRKRYEHQSFSDQWCLNKKKYFQYLKEVKIEQSDLEKFKVGQKIDLNDINFAVDNKVKISGKSRGLGFQGVVKRWGFGGGPKSHGSNFHRIPGAVGGLTSQGFVDKGKKLPGHCGCSKITIKGLKVISLDKDNGCLFVRGSVPGKKDTLLMITKQG
ncbi:50S ribosomal protein L3 [Candidatus Dependentiae bacterium]|nr:50S ribosomal protein L3 [Candidatus Dependentiae bacterium]